MMAEYAEENIKMATDSEQTGWERVAHQLPDEIAALDDSVERLTVRLAPFLREVGPELAAAEPTPECAPAVNHLHDQIDRIRSLRSRVGSIIERLDI